MNHRGSEIVRDVIYFAVALCWLVSTVFGESIVLDARQEGRTFDGIGAVSAGASSRLLIDYPEPQRSEILDYLFKPGYGASLQHLKVEIGSGVNSTDGTEPTHMRTGADLNFERGYEWWLMKEAKKRNPEIALDCLAWGAPKWIGGGKFYSQDMADYIAEFIIGAKRVHDLDIGYTGIWNEVMYDVSWIKVLRATLDKRGLSQVKIVAADEPFYWSIAEYMALDPALADAVAVIGSHYPSTVSKTALESGKPLWASEAGPWDGTWPGALQTAALLNRHYLDEKVTKTEIWSVISSYYDRLPLPNSGLMMAKEPWSGYYEVQPGLWSIAHTTQFAKPGWRYLEGGACRSLGLGGTVVSLKSTNDLDWTVVIETTGASGAQTLGLYVTNGLANGPFEVWRSSSTASFEFLGRIFPQNGQFSWTVDRDCIYTISTIAGQKGAASQPPRSKAFPLPYFDSLQEYPAGTTPRFFSDQAGTFETFEGSQGEGKGLRQVLPEEGIVWKIPEFSPYTIVGDDFLADYEVSTEVFLETEGFASLFGRIDSVADFLPIGYIAKFFSDPGRWELKKGEVELASGPTEFRTGAWHTIALQFSGTLIKVLVDGQTLWSGRDPTYAAGLTGFGSGWHTAQFRNFRLSAFHSSPNIALEATISASSYWSAEFLPQKAADGDFVSYWSSDWRSDEQWLEFDLPAPRQVSRVVIWEYLNIYRLRAWRFQAWAGDKWVDLVNGGNLQPQRSFSFPAVRSDKFRFFVDHATAPPLLREVQLLDELPASNLTINEWNIAFDSAANEDGRLPGWIELYNSGTGATDLGGYRLRAGQTNEFIFPVGTVIGSRGYRVVVERDQSGVSTNDVLSTLELADSGAITLLTSSGEIVDHVEIHNREGGAMGSYPNGGRLVSISKKATPGKANDVISCSISRDPDQRVRIRCEGESFRKFALQRKRSLAEAFWTVKSERWAGGEGVVEFIEDLEDSSTVYRVAVE